MTGLIADLRARHGNALSGVLFYGSCLRSRRLDDGVVDLYLLVDSYRDFYQSWTRAVANAVLPPNVFYMESGELPVRVKYAVLSRRQFRRAVSRRAFQSYFWGRFSQPVEIAWTRDPEMVADIEQSLRCASDTFLARALPCLPARGSLLSMWINALQMSYATELRAETAGRAQELVSHARDFYLQRAQAFASDHPGLLSIEAVGADYRSHSPVSRRLLARCGWLLRRASGKLMSIARLLKALFTFEGGLDYIAWKLSRHSGQKIEIPERVRRYPLIFIWGLFWRLRRRGVFR